MQVLLLPVNDISRQFTTENNNKDWQANKNLRDHIHVYKVECNTFVTKVSTDVFFMLQQESFYIVSKGSSLIKLWKVLIW
jgi:hypothetical protein